MSSIEQFNRTLNNRYETFKRRLDETLLSFAKQDMKQRAEHARSLAEAGQDLMDILVELDRPAWLQPLTQVANVFASNVSATPAERFLETVARRYHSVRPIKLATDSATYDFDKLYERLRDEGKLPELFDEMIDAVSKMIDSGEIDSVTVVDALRRLLDILKANRTGSYVAVTMSLDYAKFIRNLGLEFLKKIPGIKECVDAYEKTVEKTEKGYEKLQERLRDESIQMIVDQTMVARLEQLPNKQPLLLKCSNTEEEPEPRVTSPDQLEADEQS